MDGGSAALEQFVILAKTTTKASTAALIHQVRPSTIRHQVQSLPIHYCTPRASSGARSCFPTRQVLTNRKIFVFGELLAMASLQAVRARSSKGVAPPPPSPPPFVY